MLAYRSASNTCSETTNMVYGSLRFLSVAAEVKSQCFGRFLNFSKTNQLRKFEDENRSTILLIPYYRIAVFSHKIATFWRIFKFFNTNSNFASAAKVSSQREQIPYICGLRARIECERGSEHSTRSDRDKYRVSALFGCVPLPAANQN